jgi:hypothetical protein
VKKKLSLLIALCMLSMFALTACADDVTDDDNDVTIDASPTTSTAPGNGSNGSFTVTPKP